METDKIELDKQELKGYIVDCIKQTVQEKINFYFQTTFEKEINTLFAQSFNSKKTVLAEKLQILFHSVLEDGFRAAVYSPEIKECLYKTLKEVIETENFKQAIQEVAIEYLSKQIQLK